MSVHVRSAVRRHSQSMLAARLVMFELADVAHHDGTTWIRQGPAGDSRSIAFGARVSVRAVERAIEKLQELDELEVVRAQRGRKRINVYRVIVGHLREEEVDYERLGDRLSARLERPFWTPAELLLDRDERPGTARQIVGPPEPGEEEGRPDALSLDDPTDRRSTTRQAVAHAREEDPSVGPVTLDPSAAEAREKTSESSAAAVAGEAPRLARMVEALDGFAGADFASLRVVEPLAAQLESSVFEEVVERAQARCGRGTVGNPVGLFVDLLRKQAETNRRDRAHALAAAQARHDDQRLDARRRDPRTFMHRLLALPAPMPSRELADFLARYVDDDAERARLAAEELTARQETATPLGAVQHWARWVGRDLDDDVVHQQLHEWLDLWQVTDPVDRQLHHDEAEREIRAARLELAAEPEAEAA